MIVANARVSFKSSAVSGVVPTIPTVANHLLPGWIQETDIYEGEFYINSADNKVFTRINNTIVEIYNVAGSGTSGTSGTSGSSGTSGTDGVIGYDGQDAASTVRYVYGDTAQDHGEFVPSGVTFSVITNINFNLNDIYDNSQNAWHQYNAAGDVFTIRDIRDPNTFGQFTINGISITSPPGEHTANYSLTYVNGNGILTAGNTYSVSTVKTTGSSGVSGSSGSSGTSGVDGTSGIDGVAGTSGVDGTSGTSGVDGSSGTSGVSPEGGGGGLVAGVGSYSMNTDSSVSIGATAIGDYGIAIGSTVSAYKDSIVIGQNLTHAATQSIFIGKDFNTAASSDAIKSICIGNDLYNKENGGALIDGNIIIGNASGTNNNYELNHHNIVIGYQSKTDYFCENCVVIGNSLTTSRLWSVAIGVGCASAGVDSAVAIGQFASVNGGAGIAIGRTCTANNDAVAIARSSIASGDSSVAIGNGSSATAAGSVALGATVSGPFIGTTHVRKLSILETDEYADNAAAITAGLTTSQIYRTGDVLKIVHP